MSILVSSILQIFLIHFFATIRIKNVEGTPLLYKAQSRRHGNWRRINNISETFRVAHASREEVAASMGFTLLHILYKNREEVVKRSALSCKL
jgi:hypothetical protein